MASNLIRRDGVWYFQKRVPKAVAHLDGRRFVKESTGVRCADDPKARRAGQVADEIGAGLNIHWQALIEGRATEGRQQYDQARKIASRHGLNYLPAADLASSDLVQQLLKRIAVLEGRVPNPQDDPPVVRAVLGAAPPPVMTFKECAEGYIAGKVAEWGNAKHRYQWKRTLEMFAYPVIGDLPVDVITTDDVLRVLEPIWSTKTETAKRLRGRIETVLGWAKTRGYRKGDNPAVWRGHLQHSLASPSKIAPVEHHPALPYAQLPAFMTDLREQSGHAARALEFAILTGGRTSEVIGARREEINRAERMWVVPAERMKMKREHRVPLSDAALAIVDAMPKKSEYLFPAGKGGRRSKKQSATLSNMAMGKVVKRMNEARTKAGKPRWTDPKQGNADVVPHGFRSSIRDWGSEETNYPREVLEIAIAHKVGDDVEAAYRRGDLLKKRHALMRDWAAFCSGRRH